MEAATRIVTKCIHAAGGSNPVASRLSGQFG